MVRGYWRVIVAVKAGRDSWPDQLVITLYLKLYHLYQMWLHHCIIMHKVSR
jgi:hypothetical protein